MPILYHTGSGIPDSFLLLVSPDWGPGVSIGYRLETEQVKGLTGIGDHAATSRALRLRCEATYQFSAAEAVDFRTALANLQDRRWGIPLAPDIDMPALLHAAQKRVSWTDAGTVAILAPGDAVPHAHVAPLLIARLVAEEEIAVQGGAHYACRLTFEEDAPWDCRIDPLAGTAPTEWEWEPDYASDPVARSRRQLRSVSLGEGRESGVAGGDGTPVWGQTAKLTLDRAEIVGLLRFFLDRRAGKKAFAVPSWCRPGVDTPQQPHTLTARFDKDILTLVFHTPWWAEAEVTLWQEVALEEGTQELASRHFLYTFTAEGSADVLMTSCEHALTWGGETWQPARISHDKLTQTLSPLGDVCDVAVFAGEQSSPLPAYALGEMERRLFVLVEEATVDDDGAVTAVVEKFSGEVRSVEHQDDTLVAKAAAFGAMFRRSLPRFFVQRGCNYCLFSELCGVAKAAHQRTGTVGGIGDAFPSAVVWFDVTSPPTGDYASTWFAGGWLEVTDSTGKFHRRAILASVHSHDDTWTLNLNRPLPVEVLGQAGAAYPGCDGNYSTCGGKFGNADNFGGHPFVPDYISTSEGNGGSVKVK